MRFLSCSVFCGPRQFGGLLVLALVLAISGCSAPQKNGARTSISYRQAEVVSADYQSLDCARIVSASVDAWLNDPRYWLKTIACAQQYSPAEARAEARRFPAEDWQSRLKQAVLLSYGNVTPIERRRYLQRLDAFNDAFPAAIRPLLTIWQAGQVSLLQLSAERSRYAALQQASDEELEALRQRESALNQELALTRRKLDSLTDIERRLSSRRTDTSDNSHAGNRSAPDSADAEVRKPEDMTSP